MTYDLRKYWFDRALAQGPNYAGPGGRADLTDQQTHLFAAKIRAIMADLKQPIERWYGIRTVLDFGCGSGRFSPLLSTYGQQYVGVDVTPIGIAQATTRYPGTRFQWLDEDRIPLSDGSIDLVAMITVLQHIVSEDDWRTWTGEIGRVLRLGAFAVVIDAIEGDKHAAEHIRYRNVDDIAAAIGCVPRSVVSLPRHFVALLEVRPT